MDFEEYKRLLDKAYSELPDIVKKNERFEIPEVKGRIERNRTLITNFKQIIKAFNRDENHLLKYFLREAGVRGEINNGNLILYSRFNSNILKKIITKYFNEYVLCPVCKRPDTELKGNMIVCKACGAKTPVKEL